MSESNNPVMQQPHRMSRVGTLAIMAAMMGMTNGGQARQQWNNRRVRHGKHRGRNPGAFGKQR